MHTHNALCIYVVTHWALVVKVAVMLVVQDICMVLVVNYWVVKLGDCFGHTQPTEAEIVMTWV